MKLEIAYVIALALIAGAVMYTLYRLSEENHWPWWALPMAALYVGPMVGYFGRRLWNWSRR